MNETKKFFDKVTVQSVLQVAGVAVVIANMWIVTKLVPLTQDLLALSSRVHAIEERNIKADPLVVDFIGMKPIVSRIEVDIKEIKVDIKEIQRYLSDH